MKKQILIGLTKDMEAVVLEIDTDSLHSQKPYFSISGETYRMDDLITSGEEGDERAREYLEDVEMWKIIVQEGNTNLGKEDWIDSVLETDGWETVLGDIYEIGKCHLGENCWCFLGSCGQIDVPEDDDFYILRVSKDKLDKIRTAWKKLHLKEVDEMTNTEKKQLTEVEKIFEAYKSFNHEDLGDLLDEFDRIEHKKEKEDNESE